MKKIYLDYNATTPVAPSVLEKMLPFFSTHYGNASSTHSMGRAAAEAIEDARGKVAGMLGCLPEEIVFTSCATESNNLALQGTLLRSAGNADGHLIISGIEHPSVTGPARFLERLGFDLTIVECGCEGVIDPDDVRKAIRRDTRLVSVMHSNNETGTIQPIAGIAAICREHGIRLHTDAAQSCGKTHLQVDALGVDMLSIAGHKFYAPKGIGALYIRNGTGLEPFMHGSSHERGMRAGTCNTPYIVAIGAAAKMATQAIDSSTSRLGTLRDLLLERLRHSISGLVVHGEKAARLPNTLSVSFPGVSGQDLLDRIPELSASTGSACHSGTDDSSTLTSMGVPREIMRGTIRFSVGWSTSEDEIEQAASLVVDAWEKLHATSTT